MCSLSGQQDLWWSSRLPHCTGQRCLERVCELGEGGSRRADLSHAHHAFSFDPCHPTDAARHVSHCDHGLLQRRGESRGSLAATDANSGGRHCSIRLPRSPIRRSPRSPMIRQRRHHSFFTLRVEPFKTCRRATLRHSWTSQAILHLAYAWSRCDSSAARLLVNLKMPCRLVFVRQHCTWVWWRRLLLPLCSQEGRDQ